jgi:hypothetical protein
MDAIGSRLVRPLPPRDGAYMEATADSHHAVIVRFWPTTATFNGIRSPRHYVNERDAARNRSASRRHCSPACGQDAIPEKFSLKSAHYRVEKRDVVIRTVLAPDGDHGELGAHTPSARPLAARGINPLGASSSREPGIPVDQAHRPWTELSPLASRERRASRRLAIRARRSGRHR